MTEKKYVQLLHKSGSAGWKQIHPNLAKDYIKNYRLKDENAFSKVQYDDCLSNIKALIKGHKYDIAGLYIQNFEFYTLFDREKLSMNLVKSGFSEMAVNLAAKLENKKVLKDVILNMNYFQDNALASSAIKKYNLDHNEFQKLINFQLNGALRSFVKRHDWCKAEEIASQRYHFYKEKNAYESFCDILLQSKMASAALWVANKHPDKVSKQLLAKIKAKTTTEAVNNLQGSDFWGPTEVGMMETEKLEDYLTLADLGVMEEDVLLIDKDSTQEFKDACEHLLSSKMVIIKEKCKYFFLKKFRQEETQNSEEL